VLIQIDKLSSKYISIPSYQHLMNIIACFEDITSIFNICRVIDGIHIPFANLPLKKITLAIGDFFNRKKFHKIWFTSCVMQKKLFCNVCVDQPRWIDNGGKFKKFSQ
jgi:hypothetical protein